MTAQKNIWIVGCLMMFLGSGAQAKNVDLVTLPDRQGVQLTIYNSEDLTLAKERRLVTLKKGMNKLQFSWFGTLIDPTSVEFRALESADKIEVVDTIFPGQKPQHLIWNIESAIEGQILAEVSYFTSGLTWSMDYTAVVDPDETAMKFHGYVRIFNHSGEDYENAEIRLVVGTINLVEKISDLAKRQGIPVPEQKTPHYKNMRRKAAQEAFADAEMVMSFSGAMPAPSAPKRIVKEGLSEYFMFSVQGRETIRNGYSKRMIAITADEVTFEIVYRMRKHQYGPRPVRFFIWQNDKDHGLGESPLPNGLVRLFRHNGQDGLSYLGEKQVRYVPIKADIEVNLGPDDLVVYEALQKDTHRTAFHFRRSRVHKSHVDGWDEQQAWAHIIRNYRKTPIVFELQRVWDGDVEYRSKIETKLFDYRTTEVTLRVDSNDKKEYPCTVVLHKGALQKKARVQLIR